MVKRFRGDYEFLSNFYPAKLRYKGIEYYNAEAAYQAQKCSDDRQRAAFSRCYSDEAKRLGRDTELRGDWDEIKLDVMRGVVREKFEQNPRLARLLLQTGEMQLVEGNSWHDVFWGVDLKSGEGENHLGRILMELREHFKSCGITDRSAMRPRRELCCEKRLLITDEAMADISADLYVKETDRKSAGDMAPGDVRLETPPTASGRGLICVCAPNYGKDDEKLLRSCYENILELAAQKGVEDIAIPLLGMGKSCFPKQKAAEAAAEAIMGWLKANADISLQILLAPEDMRAFDYTCAAAGAYKS